MAGFETVVSDIEKSAVGMTSAAEAVGAAEPGADLKSVGRALEGGASAAAATALAGTWATRFTTWSTAAQQHGTARRSSAAAYTLADHEASLRMQADAIMNRGPAMHQDR